MEGEMYRVGEMKAGGRKERRKSSFTDPGQEERSEDRLKPLQDS